MLSIGCLLDDPSPEALQAGLAACGTLANPSGRRLLVASRSNNEVAQSLLTPRVYGSVDVIDEHDLFLKPADCRSTSDIKLLAATGGWPLLVDGYLSGRSVEMVQMLPAFLDRDVLPDLPPRVNTALFGFRLRRAARGGGVEYLFGAQREPRCLLLKTTAAGVQRWRVGARCALETAHPARRRCGVPCSTHLIRLDTQFAEPGAPSPRWWT